jgi:hypothetical protein
VLSVYSNSEMILPGTTTGLAARSLWLGGANEGAVEFILHLCGNRIDINSSLAQELSGIFDIVVIMV